MMSDTESKTKNTPEKDAATTAPYMKKDHSNDSDGHTTKSNIVIPLTLLLVSAIVIVATFYQDEYSDLLAQSEIEETLAITESENSAKTIPTVETTAMQTAENTDAAPAVETTSKQTVVEQEIQAEVTQSEAAVSEDITTATPAEPAITVASQTARSSSNRARMPGAYAPHQYRSYNNQQSQVMAKQRMEMMQQRRQAYEQEMQNRHTQYEAAAKARQEKRANMAAAQKAVFQRAQQNRVETSQKIQQIHNKISKLHEEIHMIMQESRRTATPVQMQSM